MALHQPVFTTGADEGDSWVRDVAVALFVVLMTVVVLWATVALATG